MLPNPYQTSRQTASRDANARLTPDIELAGGQGILSWFYRLAAPRITSERPTLGERELLRRGRLAALLIIAILILGIINLPIAATNPSLTELYGDIAGIVGCVIALALNRSGYVAPASLLLALLLAGGFAGIILTAPGGVSVPNLLLMPLLTLDELIAVSLLPSWTVFLFALLNSAFVLVVILEWPTDATIHMLLNESGAAGLIISPPITLYLIVAFVTFLWVRGATSALIARDRAEEFAALEHAVAEQRRNLEVGIRQIHDTLVRVANGDYSARAPIAQDSILWQLGASLNTMIARQQKIGDAQYQIQRAQAEVARLVEAIAQARAGRPPLWPAEMGTIIDPLIRALAGPRPQTINSNVLPGLPGISGEKPGAGSIPALPPGAFPQEVFPPEMFPPGWDQTGWDQTLPGPRQVPDSGGYRAPERSSTPFDTDYPDLGDIDMRPRR